MKIKLYSLLLVLLALTACSSASQIYWQEAQTAAYYANVGKRHINKGKYRQAIPFFIKALEIDPNLIVAREQLALVHYHLGNECLDWQRYDLAREQFKTAISIDPYLRAARRGLKVATRQMQLSALERE